MILISHRGNITGPNPERENSIEYITEALDKGYSVEVDIWLIGDNIYLGHDKPEYETTLSFLKNNRLWCHCKNIDALQFLLENDIHCFFHQEDDVTLTSKGYMWVYPRKKLVRDSVCVMPELGYAGDLKTCYAICSDYIGNYN
jgi:hypothetical protein